MERIDANAENMPSLETMMDAIDIRISGLLENPDETHVTVERHIELSSENWIILRSINSDSDSPYARNYDSFFLEGTTAPDFDKEENPGIFSPTCPHGPVFSFLAEESGRYHGMCIIDPELLQIFPNLDAPELGNLADVLVGLAATLTLDDIDDHQSFQLTDESSEAAELHGVVRRLLEEGTVHTRKIKRVEVPGDRIMVLESNDLSDDNLSANIKRAYSFQFKPLQLRIYDGDTSLFYSHTESGQKEIMVEPSDVFERVKDFATNIHRDEDGLVIAFSTNTHQLLEHQAHERALGMYKPTINNASIILSALVAAEAA